MSLLLENVLKHTDDDHPDQESMPLLIGVLSDFIKSTQPGIEAAEAKVKFWNIMENLVFRKGEIIVSYRKLSDRMMLNLSLDRILSLKMRAGH